MLKIPKMNIDQPGDKIFTILELESQFFETIPFKLC